MKVSFDNLIKEIDIFERKAGFDKTPNKELLKWIKEEIKNYEQGYSEKYKSNKGRREI